VGFFSYFLLIVVRLWWLDKPVYKVVHIMFFHQDGAHYSTQVCL